MRDGMKEGKKYSKGSTRRLEGRRSRGMAGCACLTMWLASYSTYRSVTLEVLSSEWRWSVSCARENRGGWVKFQAGALAEDACCGVTTSTIQPSTKEGTSVHPENHTKEGRTTKDVIYDGEFSIEVLYLNRCHIYRLRQGAQSFTILSASTRSQPVLSRWLQTLSSKC